jgi:hypothetical protein
MKYKYFISISFLYFKANILEDQRLEYLKIPTKFMKNGVIKRFSSKDAIKELNLNSTTFYNLF